MEATDSLKPMAQPTVTLAARATNGFRGTEQPVRWFGIPWGVGLLFVALVCGGCSRAPVPEFSLNTEVAELPERHQANIEDGLLRLFGTPVTPRLRVPDLDADEPEEGEPTPLKDEAPQEDLKHGAAVYTARCAGCHGVSGDGLGPAAEYLRPRPRDYRKGIFKFTSTPYGAKPARQDLVRTIRRGAKGTSMPAFPWMSNEDLDAVIDYVIFLSRRGEAEGYVTFMSQEYDEEEDIEFFEFADAVDSSVENWQDAAGQVVIPVTAEPAYGDETVVAGRELFLSKGCSKCHGVDGKGQVEWLNPEYLAQQAELPEDQREQINYDAWKEPAPAADLTARMLHGGRRPIDIYRRIYTGINGTPMPAFGDLFAEEPESIWMLAHYVRHVIEGGDPTVGIESPEPEPGDAAGSQEAELETETGSDVDSEEDEDAEAASVD